MRCFTQFSICLLLILLCMVGQTSASPGNSLDITYVIPDKYEGLLLIVFDMPGGVQYPKESTDIAVTFDHEGIARIGNPNLLWGTGKSVAKEEKSGVEIPLVGRKTNLPQPLPTRAVLRTYGTGIAIPGRRELFYDVFIVGDPKNFSDTTDPYLTYKKEVELLLSKYFGLPSPVEKPKDAK